MIIYAGDIHAKVKYIELIDKAAIKLGVNWIVQVGDFGIIWSGLTGECAVRDYFEQRKEGPTWITCGGNHENWSAINMLKQEQNCPDLIQIAPGCFFANRPATIEIEGIKHSFLGGAESTDFIWRTEGVSWWKEETPSPEEFNAFFEQIEENKPEVIVTHDAPKSVDIWRIDRDRSTTPNTLDRIFKLSSHKAARHVFGHHHLIEHWKVDSTDFFCCGLHGDYWLWNGEAMVKFPCSE